jgi:replicative DNA helicase
MEIQGEPEDSKSEFGKNEEKSIISLILDEPEYASTILPYLSEDHFDVSECFFVFKVIKFHWDKHNIVISRKMLLDTVNDVLTADDPHKDIIGVIERESDPREIPIVREKITDWAKKKAFAKLFSQESIDAHQRGDYTLVEAIVEEARKITGFQTEFFFLFDQCAKLFEHENEVHLSTGFPKLDSYINMGGPVKGDCFCFLAPTGVGKSIALVNAGAAAILKGQNVLHVTLEMSKEKTGLRYVGCFTDRWIRRRFDGKTRDFMLSRLKSIKATHDKHLIIVEYPPNDISVDVVHANINTLRRVHGINVDIVIVDYLELLNPRESVRDDRDYGIQKRVAVELCRLAKKENVLVFSAFQTNRDGNENLNSSSNDKVIELSKVAESYAKTFAVDYLVTINQNKQEYDSGKESAEDDAAITNAQCRFYVAKNRNGPKFKLVVAKINYETMKMREDESQPI